MSLIWRLIVGGLWKPLAWLFGAAGLWLAGRRSANQANKIDDLEDYRDTRKAMDNAETDLGDDPAVLREWLRERGKRPGDL